MAINDIHPQSIAFDAASGHLYLSEGHSLSLAVQPGYQANLLSRWIPALDGLESRLQAGARVADIGCGCGAATILLAEAFPNSQFYGFDTHEPSIEAARRAARIAGVTRRVYFQLGAPTDFPGWGFDLVTCFERLHEMPNPEGAARRVRSSLTPDGTWMIVEPRAADQVEEQAPSRRGSVAIRTNAPARALAGEKKVRPIVEAGGFSHFRRAAETPFNVVFEARI